MFGHLASKDKLKILNLTNAGVQKILAKSIKAKSIKGEKITEVTRLNDRRNKISKEAQQPLFLAYTSPTIMTQ